MKNKLLIAKIAALLIAVASITTIAGAAGGASDANDPLTIFNRAGELYKTGKFDQALAQYEMLAADTNPNAVLLYNLGNSYYRAQKPGLALVCYERALRLAPRDGDIRYNASFIHQLSGEPDQGFVQYMASLLTGSVSLNEAAILSLILLYLCTAFAALWLLRRYSLALMAAIFSAFLLAGSSGMLLLKVQDEIFTRHAVVTTGPAEVRNGPDMNESVGFSLPEGRSVEILSTQGEWTAIAIKAEGLKGWVATKNIQSI